MDLWEEILIVIGCIIAGLLVGLLLLRVFLRKKEKGYSLDKEAKTIETKNAQVHIATTLNKEITKSTGYEDPLEVLLKDHKNSITAENLKQPHMTATPGGVEIDAEKNNPVIQKEEKPTQPVMHWTEPFTPTNQLTKDEYQRPYGPPITEETVAVNQKSTSLKGDSKKTVASSLRGPENIIQKTAPVKEIPKKASKANVAKKTENIIQQGTPMVKDAKKEINPLSEKPDIIKQGIPVAEIYHESTKLKSKESADVEQKIIPVQDKGKETLKSELIIEMEANLAIASKPWEDKLVSFQTKCWDSHHGEFDVLFDTYHQELIQLYVDIGLANNIVWLATEINHRSKELDNSYIRLCSGIADNIKIILP